MEEAQSGAPSPDDTAAFQRFYSQAPSSQAQPRHVLYRMLIGWWRDRR
jgi:hypothetical protein